MSNLDQTPFRTWTGADLPVYGRTSTTTEHVLGGATVSGASIDGFIGGVMATDGFGRTAVKAPGTSAWRPPDC